MLDLILEIDKSLFEYLTLYFNWPIVQQIAEATANMKNYAVWFLLFCIFYFVKDKTRALKFLLFFVILFIVSESFTSVVKGLIARPRPGVATGLYFDNRAFSFPSAHSLNTMALAVFLAWWFNTRQRAFVWFSLFMGACRVLSNYHYPLDVIMGWIGGYALGSIYVFLLNHFALHESRAYREFIDNLKS